MHFVSRLWIRLPLTKSIHSKCGITWLKTRFDYCCNYLQPAHLIFPLQKCQTEFSESYSQSFVFDFVFKTSTFSITTTSKQTKNWPKIPDLISHISPPAISNGWKKQHENQFGMANMHRWNVWCSCAVQLINDNSFAHKAWFIYVHVSMWPFSLNICTFNWCLSISALCFYEFVSLCLYISLCFHTHTHTAHLSLSLCLWLHYKLRCKCNEITIDKINVPGLYERLAAMCLGYIAKLRFENGSFSVPSRSARCENHVKQTKCSVHWTGIELRFVCALFLRFNIFFLFFVFFIPCRLIFVSLWMPSSS